MLGETAVLFLAHLLFVCYLQGERHPEEEESQPVLTQNGSPRPNRVEFANQQSPEVYDVRLQRKENEGFGFVILTSKNKPPPGGKCRVVAAWRLSEAAAGGSGAGLPRGSLWQAGVTLRRYSQLPLTLFHSLTT